MGMLLRYHTEVRPACEAKPPPQQAPTEVPDAPEADVPAPTESAVYPEPENAPQDVEHTDAPDAEDPYAGLSDEQVAEAYATNVGGRATKRETQVDQLRALDAESDADQPTEGGSDSE